MKLVQVYLPLSSSSMGFSTIEDMFKFWKESILIHKQHYDVCIYTNQKGYNIIAPELLDLGVNIIVIEFDIPDSRFWNVGKILTHLEQTEQYIMCDIDAVIYDIITQIETDVICENIRRGFSGRYNKAFQLERFTNIPCSGILGFKNVSQANTYAQMCIAKLQYAKDNQLIREVDFEALWHLEEGTLANFVSSHNLTISKVSNYKHLQAGLK